MHVLGSLPSIGNASLTRCLEGPVGRASYRIAIHYHFRFNMQPRASSRTVQPYLMLKIVLQLLE